MKTPMGERPSARQLAESSGADTSCPDCGCIGTEGRSSCRVCGRAFVQSQVVYLKRVANRPLCAKHGDTMIAGSSLPSVTYYYCRIDGCANSGKAPRR